MVVDTVIAGGTVVTPEDTVEASLAIDDGTIVAVGGERTLPDAEERVDASGLLVMPGLVDPHVHIDEVPENRASRWEDETGAAAVGGVTSVIDFAWQGGDRSSSGAEGSVVDGIEFKREKGEERAVVDFGFHAVPTHEEPETIEAFERAVEMGVTSFKMFMSTYRVGVSNGFIDLAMEEIADLDAVALLHTEDPSVCEARTEQQKREGKGDARHYPDARPDYAEAMGAADAVRMALEAGCKYYGVHTTCRKAADAIAGFQGDGSQVRAETCAHYTAFDRSIYERMGNLPVLAPPIRTEDDIEAMFEHIRAGTLSVVSTDHAVYHRRFKEEAEDWWDSPFGATGLEYSLAALHTEGVKRRGLSYPKLVRLMSTNPARTFGVPGKGTLEPGTDADVVLFDPEESWTITEDDNVTGADYTIWDGYEATGRVEKTFARGDLVAEDGAVVADPGRGEYLERELPDWEP